MFLNGPCFYDIRGKMGKYDNMCWSYQKFTLNSMEEVGTGKELKIHFLIPDSGKSRVKTKIHNEC